MSSITAGTCPGCTLLTASLCLPPYVSFPWHIILSHFLHTQTQTHKQAHTLNYGWTLWHCDDTFVISIQSHSLKGCPSLCHLEFTFWHLTFTERLRTAVSADVSLTLTQDPDSVDTYTDSTWGPEMVQNMSSIFRLSFEVQLSSSHEKRDSSSLFYFLNQHICSQNCSNDTCK